MSSFFDKLKNNVFVFLRKCKGCKERIKVGDLKVKDVCGNLYHVGCFHCNSCSKNLIAWDNGGQGSLSIVRLLQEEKENLLKKFPKIILLNQWAEIH